MSLHVPTPMGSRRRGEEFTKWNLSIPTLLAARFERLLHNPAYNKPTFGSKSQVVTNLLEQYVSSLEAEIESAAKEMLSERGAA